MYTNNSSYRTWATAAAVFVLLAGLCSVVSGSIAVGAEEPDSAWIGGFAESGGYAFAESGWLGVEDDAAPETADAFDPGDVELPIYEGQGPDIDIDLDLSGCDGTPEMSVAIAITGEEAIEYLSVNGTAGNEPIEVPVAFEPGDKTVTHTEVIDLTDMKEAANTSWSWNNFWLHVEVVDVTGNVNFEWVDVSVDFDDCTTMDFGQWIEEAAPEIVVDSLTLGECASSPQLTVAYTVTSENGLNRAWLEVVDQAYESVASFVYEPGSGFDAGATEVAVTESVDLQELRDDGRDYVELSFNATAANAWDGWSFSPIELDFDACTAEVLAEPRPYLVGGDGLYPEITVTSVEVDECAATPVLSVGYTISDTDGIAELLSFAYFFETDEYEEPEVDFEVGAGEVQVTVDVTVKAPNLDLMLDAMDGANTFSSSGLMVNVDTTDCTVEYVDFADPEGWSEDLADGPEDRNMGPTIEIESLSIASCDTSPVLSVGYAISDEAGISNARIYLGDEDSGALIDPGSSATELSGEYSFDEYSPLLADEDYLYIEAANSAYESNWFDVIVVVDFENCQVETKALR